MILIFVYFILTLPKVSILFYCIGTLLLVLSAMILAGYEKITDTVKNFFTYSLILFLLATVIPNKETSYILAGTFLAQKAYTSEIGQALEQKILAEINSFKEKEE